MMKASLCVLIVVSALMLRFANAAEVVVSFNEGQFYAENTVIGQTSFDELPLSAGGTAYPGGAPEYYDYFDFFDFGGVLFTTIGTNANLPGFYRYSDIKDDGQRNSHDALGGDYLNAGLAPGGPLEGLGLKIDFSDLDSAVNVVGMSWGQVRAAGSEPSPCCIRHYFGIELSTGEEVAISLSPSNRYLGLERELLPSDFISFRATEGTIRSIEIRQSGHNPGLTNLVYGFDLKPRTVRPVRVIDMGGGGDPKKRIAIEDERNTDRTLEEFKSGYCDAVGPNLKISEFADRLSQVGSRRADYFLNALANFTLQNSRILQKYCDDPPRFDYTDTGRIQSSSESSGFIREFGNGLKFFDNYFRLWQYGLNAQSLALTALERLQGAMLDSSEFGIDLQLEEASHWLTESDSTYLALIDSAKLLPRRLSESNIENVESQDLDLYSITALFGELFSEMRIELLARKDAVSSPPALSLRDNEWKLISFPADLMGLTLRDLTADYLEPAGYASTWIVYRYISDLLGGGGYEVVELDDTLSNAEGYWIISKEVPAGELSLGDAIGILAPTVSDSCATPRGCMEVDVNTSEDSVSWSLVGSAFSKASFFGLARIKASGECESGCTFSEANLNRIVGGNAWRYDGETGEYLVVDSLTSLEPWEGIWLPAYVREEVGGVKLFLPAPIQ